MFRLRRYFSITSLAGILVTLVGLSLFYRHLAVAEIETAELARTGSVTRHLMQTHWPAYSNLIAHASRLPVPDLAGDPVVQEFRYLLLDQLSGYQAVVKLKVYGMDGTTLFSTDPFQIGENKAENGAFRRAREGGSTGHITYRDQFSAFEGTVFDRNLAESYVPIRMDANSPVEGVLELYTDVTPLVARIDSMQVKVVAGVAGALTVLYAFLFFIVNRADRVLRRQARDRAKQEKAFRHQAYHDALTDLPNRAAFTRDLARSVPRCRASGWPTAVMFLDLDRFKLVNDTLGHAVGDELLRVTAGRIGRCLRDGDRLYRMGGDEFTVLAEELHRPEDAAAIARRIVEAVAEPLQLEGQSLEVAASVGIAICPADGTGPEVLLRCADAAMYEAKEAGGGAFRYADRENTRRVAGRFELEAALRRAARGAEFRVRYRPRLAASGDRWSGLVVELAWAHPARGLLEAGSFREALEESGLAPEVDGWLVEEACRDMCRWREAGLAPPRVCLPVGGGLLTAHGFADRLVAALGESALSAADVEVAADTGAAMPERTTGVARALRANGIRLQVRGFGSGSLGLAGLRRLSPDSLLLSPAVIEDLAGSDDARRMVGAVREVAAALGADLVAEGVADPVQAEHLARCGCSDLQGPLYGPGMDAASVGRYLEGATGTTRAAAPAAAGHQVLAALLH